MATRRNGKRAERRILIPRVDTVTIEIDVVGLTPLIVHRFPEKARNQMREKQGGRGTTARERRDPEADFLGSLYTVPGCVAGDESAKYYFPAAGFKRSMVDGCRYMKGTGLTMTKIKTTFYVLVDPDTAWPRDVVGGPIIRYDSLSMREDPVRVGQGTADLRYRGQFEGWSTTLRVEFSEDDIAPDQIIALAQKAGWHNGIGEWRPSAGAGGEYGRFEVVDARSVDLDPVRSPAPAADPGVPVS